MEYLYSNPYIATSVILGLPIVYFFKKYYDGANCELICDLSDKIIIITGCSQGIGKETARCLAFMRARIIFACKQTEESEKALQEIKKETNNEKLELIHIDLGDFNSIRLFATKFKHKYRHLDILINNAGVANTTYQVTKDGYESNYAINYLGHFLLTNMLLDFAIMTPQSRIINVSSSSHANCTEKINFDDICDPKQFQIKGFEIKTYNYSKLAIILFTKELQRRVGERVKVVSLHPGFIRTELQRDWKRRNKCLNTAFTAVYPLYWLLTKDALQGAQTILYCALEKWEKLESGGYYVECQLSEPSQLTNNIKDAQELWDQSVNNAGLI